MMVNASSESAFPALAPLMDNIDIAIVTERFERRLSEECGKLRVENAIENGKLRAEMAAGFGQLRGEMHAGFGALRAEMIDRNSELLKWGLAFAVAQTAALGTLMTIFR